MPGAVVSSMTMSRSSWWSRVQSFWLSSNLPPVLLTVGVGAIQVIGTTFAGEEQPARESLDVLGYLLLLVGPIALLARKRHPVAVLATALATTVLYIGLGYPYGPVFLSVVVALFTTILDGHRLAAWLLGLAGYLGIVLVEALNSTGPDVSVGEALGDAAWLVVVLVVAEVVRARSERIREAEHAQEEEELRRRSATSGCASPATSTTSSPTASRSSTCRPASALHLMDQQPEQARTALTAIKQASSEALQELRSVLDVLRQGDGADEQAPRARRRPGSTSSTRSSAGRPRPASTCALAVEGTRRPLPASVDLAAYRIVQEALTNVARATPAPARGHDPRRLRRRRRRRRGRRRRPGRARRTARRQERRRQRHRRACASGRGRSAASSTPGPAPAAASGCGRGCPSASAEREARRDPRPARRRPGAGAGRASASLLDAEADIEVVGEAGDGAEAVELARAPRARRRAHGHPHARASTASRRPARIAADARARGVRVIILTTFDLDEYVFEALRAGASGFLVKDTEPVELLRGDPRRRRRRRAAVAERHPPARRRVRGPARTAPERPRAARRAHRPRARGGGAGRRGAHQRRDRRARSSSARRPRRPTSAGR